MKNIFIQGPVPATLVTEQIQKHSHLEQIGAHSIFLGQVRRDEGVTAIEYTAYEAMALEQMHEIREAIIPKYGLSCMHVYHSLGIVKTGEICLFVFTSAPRRKAAIAACEDALEQIKTKLPIWGKEIFGEDAFQWKQNT
ncbi:molybdenum cofactor biosynthesis protein MoaE [Chitinophaga horti]|uniref:Molybdopterin synthase catalytic subunit n=1 Tax=Chitinophaga horti TaxID=2920382 RepID=A0ABY6IVU9_9BACT|nr:molybdenum cofactor biosynthesis protein MoaE [Chitinophaga horti]UYQ91405.1 molybdenum cofactor biosynthesis protein MoaE [Chitinophaga horti]